MSHEQDFSQIKDYNINYIDFNININFRYRTNSVKVNANFCLNSKNPIFGPIPQFLGQERFVQKIWLCHTQLRKSF